MYDAASGAGLDLDPHYLRRTSPQGGVLTSPFPAQIRFTALHSFPPLEEKKFCHLVEYNDK